MSRWFETRDGSFHQGMMMHAAHELNGRPDLCPRRILNTTELIAALPSA